MTAAGDRTRVRRGAVLLVCVLAWLVSVVWAQAQTGPRDIRVGVFVTSVSSIEPSDGSFRVAGYLWFIDPAGKFDPESDMELLVRSGSTEVFAQRDLPDGASYTAVAFDGVVDHPFDVREYPFDEQRLVFQVEAAKSIGVIKFVPDNTDSRVADFVRAPGWRTGALELAATDVTYDTGFGVRTGRPTFSRLAVSLDLERNLSPFLFEKFTGFFVAFVITVLVVFVPIDEFGTRVGMTTGSVFAAVFNRYRMEDATGFDAVFGLVDQVSMLTFSVILQILILTLVVHRRSINHGSWHAVDLNRRVGAVIIGVHVALGVLVFVLALR